MVEDNAGPSGAPTLGKEGTSEHVDGIDDIICEGSECDSERFNALVKSLGIEGVDL